MALSQISIPPDLKRDARAIELAKTAHTWPKRTLLKPWGSFEAGTVFRVTPSGYLVNAVACQCPDYQQSGNICKHVRAMVLSEQRGPIREVRGRYEHLFPPCRADGCNEPPEDGEKDCYRHTLCDAF